MHKTIFRFCTAITFVLCAGFSNAQVVISQIYSGGSTTGYFLNDYIELLNTSFTTFTLTNHTLQYGTSSGNFGSTASNVYGFPSGTTIKPRGYLLIKCGTSGTSGTAVTGYDLDTGAGIMEMGIGAKVALVNQTTALGLGSTGNPLPLPDTRILDLVAWGHSNNAEGGAAANYGNTVNFNQVIVRKTNGLQDTNNNGADFTILPAGPPNGPRNSNSPTVDTAGVGDWMEYR